MKNKGRYVLLTAALAGAYFWHGPQATATVTATQVTTPLQTVTAPPTGPDAPATEPSVPCVTPPEYREARAAPRWLSGDLGLFVARIDPDSLQVIDAVGHNADEVFPLASSYKVPVLWATLKDVDAGRISVTERFTITPEQRSLGGHPADGSDLPTMLYRMIHNSDNTATDILHRRVGLAAPQRLADDLHLCHTRLILPTKTWWTGQAGMAPAWAGPDAFTAARGDARLKLAEQLDATARTFTADQVNQDLERYFASSWKPEDDVKIHNVSTASEYATLLAHAYLRNGLSPSSAALFDKTMASGYGQSKLTVRHDQFGGKGGNGHKILSMTGYVHTLSGDHIVYVFFQHNPEESYTIPNLRSAFDWINFAVDDLEAAKSGPTSQRPSRPAHVATLPSLTTPDQ